jgi:hypothetical protein
MVPLILLLNIVSIFVSDIWASSLFFVLMRLKSYRLEYTDGKTSGFDNNIIADRSDNREHMDAADDEKFDAIYNIDGQ